MNTFEVSPTLIIVLVLIVIGICGFSMWGMTGAADLHIGSSPGQQAEATVVAQMAPQATAQALAIATAQAGLDLADQQAMNNIRLSERLQLSSKMRSVLAVATICIIIALIISATSLTIYMSARAFRSYRASRLPAVRVIGPHLLIVESSFGPEIIDTLTGRRSLLANPAEVDELRAAYISRLQIAERLASAAETIAHDTKSAQPADWLPAMAAGDDNKWIVRQ